MESTVENTSVFDLSGKAALITGASRGIGRAIALAYARAGSDVAVLARGTDELKELANEIEVLGRRCLVLTCDVSDRDQAERAVEAAVEEFGRLDILVNNAGSIGAFGPFLDLELSDWETALDTNVKATIYFCRAAGRHMTARGSGVVINMASVSGVAGVPMLSHYALTKAAIISLTSSLGSEWADTGVRVNAIAPGWIDTKLTETVVSNPGIAEGLLHAVPAKRWGDTDDVVGPAIFLASSAAEFVTGATLVVDGGLTSYVGGPTLLDLRGMGRVVA
jgi:NAD(P)-dependent dehydrogenase (short-subunit alcohol dehydrogenase family)